MNIARLLARCGITAVFGFGGTLSGAAEAPPGPPEFTSEPISPELGLFDLRVRGVPDGAAGIELAFDEDGGPSEVGRVRLRRGAEAPGPVWRARLMHAPGPDGAVEFWLHEEGAEEWAGPFEAKMRAGDAALPPAWALGTVWYQVFPERFANGNPKNDPGGPEVFRREWTSAWDAVSVAEVEAAWARAEGEPARFRFNPDQAGGALYSVATARRYGGDLEGLCAHLESLADLGVMALYLNPVFDAPSMHKYDAADYRHIDPSLAGDNPAERPADEDPDPAAWRWTSADRYFVGTLLPEARRRGIRVVLDGVWNHTSTRFWAFRDVASRGRSSPFSGWYQASFDGDRLSGWTGWPNRPNGGLPQFARGADGNIVAPVRAHIADITRRWMDPDADGDPSDGIDGWRLDVAPDIPTAFWREWCPLVRSINPEAAMFGEVWFFDRERIGHGIFDAQMNYPFAIAAVKWLDRREGFGGGELGKALAAAGAHPAATNLAQMNLLGSHDTARIATMLNNPGWGYGGREKVAAGAGGYQTGRPGRSVYERVLLGVALQAMWPGAPMIYAGDEWGAYGADDPDDRKPVPWPDLGRFENPDEGPDATLRQEFRRWLTLRQDPDVGPVLRYGDVEWLAVQSPELAAFIRRLNGKAVLCILNRSDEALDAGVQVDGRTVPGVIAPRTACWRWLP